MRPMSSTTGVARLFLAGFLVLGVTASLVKANEAEDEELEDEVIDPTALRGIPKSGKRMANEEGQAVLKCIYNATESPIEWFQVTNGVETRLEGETADGDFDITFDRSTGRSVLALGKEQVVRGEYRCKASDESEMSFTVEPFFKLVKFPKSTQVEEAEDLKLKCKMRPGSEDSGEPQYEWFTKDENDLTLPGVKLTVNMSDSVDGEPHIRIIAGEDEETNMPMSILKIEDARYSDRNVYQCIAKNGFGQMDEVETLVRVKDRYAALYPFAGIVAEVIILCLVIFICEKRSGSKDGDDEDGEDAGYNGNAGNSNARQRRA